MATITQPAVEAPVVQPISSGGGGGTRARVARDQTYLVFSDDGPRPVSQEEPPRGLSTAEAPAAGIMLPGPRRRTITGDGCSPRKDPRGSSGGRSPPGNA